MFAALEAYRDEHGDCHVPQGYNYSYCVSSADDESESTTTATATAATATAATAAAGEENNNNNNEAEEAPAPLALGKWLNTQRIQKRKGSLGWSRADRLAELGVVWDVQSHQWETMYSLLRRYKEREGDCNAKANDDTSRTPNLGGWLNRQRLAKRRGTLDRRLEDRLTDLGVVWDVFDQQWESMYALLLRYKDREGDCAVPFQHVEDDGEKLGMWLNTQRYFRKNGDLDRERIALLDSAGVVWDVLGKQWESMYALLSKYKERTGHCGVPLSHREDGKNLGTWLNKQRHDYKKGTLDGEKADSLEAIGVVWNLTAQQWNGMYELLVRFQDREGHCNVPQNHLEEGEKLGMWLGNQRTYKRLGKLDSNAKRLMDELGVVWDTSAKQWDDMYQLLVRYQERNGDCNVPRSHQEDGKNLGNWANTQRAKARNGKLSSERIQRLDDIGFLMRIKR
eukprot:jgi/Psemu1/186623/e_gw1.60.20.1